MKKILILIGILIALCIFAEEEVLFSGDVHYGGYGAPTVGFTSFDDDMHVLVGGRGGLILNHSLAIGGGGFGKVTRHERTGLPFFPDSTWDVNMGAGGLFVEYIWGSERVLHFTVESSFYWGGVAYSLWKDYDYDDDDDDYEDEEQNDRTITDAFFMIEPGANLELNMFEWMRLDFGVKYRVMTGIEKMGYGNADFSGVNASLMVKFGDF